jgi:hypothetical protein
VTHIPGCARRTRPGSLHRLGGSLKRRVLSSHCQTPGVNGQRSPALRSTSGIIDASPEIRMPKSANADVKSNRSGSA